MTEQVKNIQVEYFAILKEQAGRSSEALETGAETARQLYRELARRHSFSLREAQLAVAVNDDFKDWDCHLNDRDKVVFIPPVAGG